MYNGGYPVGGNSSFGKEPKEEKVKEATKPFDPTVCFTFFGTWVHTIFRLETEADKESQAYMLFKAIAEYCMYDIDPNFEDSNGWKNIEAIWPLIEREADNSIGRRKRGFSSDAISVKHRAIINAIAEDPEASLRKIAERVGVDKSMVHRVKVKYRDEIEKEIALYSEEGLDPEEYEIVDENGEGIEKTDLNDDSLPF